jgi:P27 family predicted phage terminase small subunit
LTEEGRSSAKIVGRRGDNRKTKEAKAGYFRKPDSRDRRKKVLGPKRLTLSNDERASLLASLPAGEIPEFMAKDGMFDEALQIWKDLSPGLKRLNALSHPDRYAFAMYCVHVANWIEAEREIRKAGATYTARNSVNGDELQKLSPWVRVREISERHILEIGSRFGLDPYNRFKLLKEEALVPQGFLPGLGQDQQPASQPAQEESGAATGALARAATPPPGQLPN